MQGSAHDPLRKIQAKHAPETKADIGTVLKAARQKRGQSLEAVVSHTRIPKKFIEALEGNRLDEFPAMAYLRGFLKTYCDYLEIDFDPLWKLISPPPPAPEEAGAPAQPGAPAKKAAAPAHPHAKKNAHEHEDGPPLAAVAALVGAALLAALLALGLRPRGEEPATPAVERTVSVAQADRAAGESNLVLEFREDSWVSLSADGGTLYEGRVPRNARQEWKGHKTLLLKTTSPDALRLTLNGNKFPLPAPDERGVYRVQTP